MDTFCTTPFRRLALTALTLGALACTGSASERTPPACLETAPVDDCVLEGTRVTLRTVDELEHTCKAMCSRARALTFSLDTTVSLQGFTGLSTIDTSLRFVGNAELTHVDALTGLRHVGNIEIVNNPVLQHLPNFPHLNRLLGLRIDRTPLLSDLHAFSELREVSRPDDPRAAERGITLANLQRLEDLQGLTHLERAATLSLHANPNLRSLKGPENLHALHALHLHANPKLHTLGGLDALQRLDTLTISGSPELRRCEVDALLSRLASAPQVVELKDLSNAPCS
ncbi:hypothetical protein DL240_13655 [Lujinxingia litoralis]|uniref:Leucine-rich repeat domain-containing protein n=1 Tax=Lujinxingia litoralis TaxID=2211119 RepID=A0A328C301_9DELT|nr:hypothetical protein [Lujinxingia litoralis]RAL21173.1 hypothetical protein DL240_13655 [Lujinxingia litoralis]